MSKADEAATLLAKAEQFMAFGGGSNEDMEEVRKSAEQALETYRELRDLDGQACALQIIIRSLHLHAMGEDREPEEGLRLATEQLQAFRQAGFEQGEVMMMINLVEMNMDKRGPVLREEALVMAKEARAKAQRCDDKELEAKATQAVAKVLVKKCDKGGGPVLAKEGVRVANESLAMFRQLGDRKEEGITLFMLFAAKMWTEASIRDGMRYAKEAVVIFKELGLKWWQAVVLRSIADWFRMKGQGREGVPYAEEAMDIFQEIAVGRGWEEACMSTIVGTYIDKEDKSGAVERARELVERMRASGDKFKEAQATSVLATAMAVNGDCEEALSVGEVALAIYKELGNKQAQMRQLEDFGQFHMENQSFKEAAICAKDALEIAVAADDMHQQSFLSSFLCRIHMAAGEYQEALAAADEAIGLYQAFDDREGEAICLLNKSSIHAQQGEVQVALAEVEDARLNFLELQHKDREAQTYYFAAEIEMHRDNHEEAVRNATLAREIYKRLGQKDDESAMLIIVAQSSLQLADKAAEAAKKHTSGSKPHRDSCRQIRRLYTTSVKCAKESLAIARKLGERDHKQYHLVNSLIILAQGQGLMGKFPEALRCANEGLHVTRETGERKGECSALLLIGQLHGWQGRVDEAKVWLSQAANLASTLQDEYLEYLASQFLESLQPQAPTVIGEFSLGPSSAASAPAQAAASRAAPAGSGDIGPYRGPELQDVLPKINDLAMSLLSTDEIAQDNPLMDSGLDSLSMVQFRNQLQSQFPGIPMPASLVFDHPSIRAVSENIVEEMKAAHAAGKAISRSS